MFKLDEHIDFEIGAYSDDHTERAALVPIAQQRASLKHGAVFDRRNTVIIGDSISDLQAAKQGGAAFLGVASSSQGVDALRSAAGDVRVLEELAQIDELLAVIQGR